MQKKKKKGTKKQQSLLMNMITTTNQSAIPWQLSTNTKKRRWRYTNKKKHYYQQSRLKLGGLKNSYQKVSCMTKHTQKNSFSLYIYGIWWLKNCRPKIWNKLLKIKWNGSSLQNRWSYSCAFFFSFS